MADHDAVARAFKEDNKRRRRVDEQEKAALFAHAPRHIEALLIARHRCGSPTSISSVG